MISKYVLDRSSRKGKQLKVTFMYKGKLRVVHFGDPAMREYPGTVRGDAYCTRSYGIRNKQGKRTSEDPLSPNYWSRKILWRCKGKKSIR